MDWYTIAALVFSIVTLSALAYGLSGSVDKKKSIRRKQKAPLF